MIRKTRAFIFKYFFYLPRGILIFCFLLPFSPRCEDTPSLSLPGTVSNSAPVNMEKNLLRFYDYSRNGKTTLLQSFSNTSSYLDDTLHEIKNFMKTDAGYLSYQSFTYDMAIASLVYILAGEYQKSADILDDFADNFWVPKNGLFGLYNSYRTDQYDYFYRTPGGRRNLLIIGIDGSRIHTGPNLWVGIACQHFFMETGSTRFIPFMLDIFNWCRNLNHSTLRDGSKGAISMGYGWGPPWEIIYATEHNLDHYAFVNNLKQILSVSNREVQRIYQEKKVSRAILDDELENILKWLKEVAHNPRGTFNRGFNDYGVDSMEALDLTSWGISSLKPDLMLKMGIDPEKMAERAEALFHVEVEVDGKIFQGFDFTDESGYKIRRKNRCIWFEGTGQMILAYHVLANYFQSMGNQQKERLYREKALFQLGELRRFSTFTALKNNALPYCSLNLKAKEVAYTFNDWWPIARGKNGQWVPSVIATSWWFFGEKRFNPLDIFTFRKNPKNLNLTLEDKPPDPDEAGF